MRAALPLALPGPVHHRRGDPRRVPSTSGASSPGDPRRWRRRHLQARGEADAREGGEQEARRHEEAASRWVIRPGTD